MLWETTKNISEFQDVWHKQKFWKIDFAFSLLMSQKVLEMGESTEVVNVKLLKKI